MSNINYELAKQLKDAGFPQVKEPTYGQGYWYSENGGEGVYIPTLSELIGACGDWFFRLTQIEDGKSWVAGGVTPGYKWKNSDRQPITYLGLGPTPEEAVAKLWLELQKK